MKTINKFGRRLSVHVPGTRAKKTSAAGQTFAATGIMNRSVMKREAAGESSARYSLPPSFRHNASEISKAKHKFLEAAVHEFSAPLNTIILSADLIEKYYDTLSKQSILNEVTGIKTAATYLSAIINDFLSAENINKNELQPAIASFDLRNLAETIVGQMKQQTRDWQDIKYTHTGPSSHVSLDKKLLEYCLVNLISNAIKYSDVADHIEVGSEISGDTCRIWVKDYGIGIPEKEAGRVFEPFFRASNAAHIEGTGLGLNLVKRYTELMGGKVTVEKNGKKGTVFNLVFPVTPWHSKRRNLHSL